MISTFILWGIVLLYAIRQGIEMARRSEIVVRTHSGIGDGLVQSAEGYGSDKKLNIAFGVADFFDKV